MKLTVSNAIRDIRETFLSQIFKDYPKHKKMWSADEIQNEFSSAMHHVAMEYFEKISEERN